MATQKIEITFPELGLVAGTRAALGAGVALLLADRLSPDSRKAVGWTLLAVGALTTVPLVLNALQHRKTEPAEEEVQQPRFVSAGS